MFFIDKYGPNNKDEMFYNQDVYDKLNIMSKDESIPHIIFYGPNGSGKKTIIKMFLEMLYDKSVHNLVEYEYMVNGSGNSTVQVVVKQSNYHIIIEPNNNNFDRYLIQDVVKAYARRVPLNVFATKKVFKTVLINNVDNLSYYAQTSLRRTLEKYSKTCRFIMWSNSLSRVIDPLRSRCYCFLIKSPTRSELLNRLLDVDYKENTNLKIHDFAKIIDNSGLNVKKALWMVELFKFSQTFETTYDDIIELIVKKIIESKITSLITIRELLYKIMITNINGSNIIKDILDALLISNINDNTKCNIVEIAAKYEHNLVRGRREIIHLDGFITSTMYQIITTNNNKINNINQINYKQINNK